MKPHPEARTRPVVAGHLTAAGWTRANDTDRRSPDGMSLHSWPVALMLARLPRVVHAAGGVTVAARLCGRVQS